MSGVLTVYLRNRRAGRLWLEAKGRLAFQYDDNWLASAEAVPLSLSLPLRAEVYPDDAARPFFANLLPESQLRVAIARRLGISEGNDFGLLEAIGGECAGAVSLLPDGAELSETGEYRPLDTAELAQLIQDLPKRPMLAGEAGIRLSLAGVQNKLPVYYDPDADKICLPTGMLPSLHILKPPIPHFADTVQNEAFCTQLARRMGLPVPDPTCLHRGVPLYLVTRYDREVTPEGRIRRLHQEDFCQALGIPPDNKYEKEGGPSLAACFRLLREYSIRPAADIKAMLQWVLFNFLIGNADAHGKNVSLLLGDQGPQLAPFYDMMSTAVYPELNDRLAMRIGGEDRPGWIIARRWEQFAAEIGVQYKMVRRMLTATATDIVPTAQTLHEDFGAEYGECETVSSIVDIITQRAKKALASLAAAEKTDEFENT